MIRSTILKSFLIAIACLGMVVVSFGQGSNSADKTGAIQLHRNQALGFPAFLNGGGVDKSEIGDLKTQLRIRGNPIERNTVWFILPTFEVLTAVSFIVEDYTCSDDLDVILVSDTGVVLASEMTGGGVGESRGQDDRCRWQFQGDLEGQVYALVHNYTSTDGFSLEFESTSVSADTEVVLGAGQIKIWPNPAKEQLFVQANSTKGDIVLVDASGKVCASSNTVENLSIRNCASGVLLLNVRMEGGEYSTQILKL